MADDTPQRFGRYLVECELGRGAMGVVYRALDPMLDRTVAVKTIALSTDPRERERSQGRFYQEAKAAGGLNHRAIVTIYDVGREEGLVWMAMELIEGIELRDELARGRISVERAVDIAAQVADGLAFAHERGVIHRDIKPAQHHAGARRPGEDHGLRHRAAVDLGREDPDGHAARLAEVHVAGAGRGQRRGPALGHLLPRRGALRDVDRRWRRSPGAT